MEFAEAVAALDARTNYERSGRLTDPSIERIRALVDMLDHPERGFPVIHITGTNGKSTTARAATEVLRAAGLKVATYTSPHVSSVRERFAFDGEPISEEDFVEAWRELAPYLDHFDSMGQTITWFEAVTALAFLFFADKAVEAAVIEVGMGGTWDATNVANADVAAFTEIGGDHPELGATPAEVAAEKAGILKDGTEGLSVVQTAEVREVLDARGSVSYEPDAFSLSDVRLAMGGQVFNARIGDVTLTDAFLPLFGEHLVRDAVLGAAAAHTLLGGIAAEVIGAGLADVRIPGRMEVLRRKPLVVLDGAHNPPAARALAVGMRQSFQWAKLRLIVSVMADKDVAGILEALVPLADEIIVTRNNSPRAASVLDLEAAVRATGFDHVSIVEHPRDALAVATERSEDADAILVTGSIYTVGDARG